MFHGLGYKAVRILAYEYATRLGRNVPDSWNHGKISGRDWMSGFKSRHKNLCLRSPEATSIALTHGFNKKVVYLFFSFLSEAFVKHKFEANVVYNLDESGITTVQRVPKVIAEKGTKQVGHITAQVILNKECRVKVRFSLRAIVLSLEKSECNNSGYKLTGLTWWP